MSSEKLNILEEFRNMIANSWTFKRLTKKEQERIFYILSENHIQTREALKGNKKACWNILQAIYSSFLIALDYNPTNWREGGE